MIFSRQQFETFYRQVPERVLIILDEAYFEHAQDDPLFYRCIIDTTT